MHTGFWWVHLWETDHFENSGIDGRIILRWIFRKWDGGGGPGTGWIWFGLGKGGGLL